MAAGLEGSFEHSSLDIRDEEAVDAFIGGVVERHGRIDLLVNNAGGQFLSPAEAITPKGFRTVIELNVQGTWLMTHAAAAKAFIPQNGGKVVSVTLTPHHGMPGMVHSGAARAAVENMMRTLSIEWARFQIKLCAVAVGPVRDRDAAHEVPAGGRRQRLPHGAAANGSGSPRRSPGWSPISPPRPATSSPARCSRSTVPATTGSGPGRPRA